MLCGRKVAVRWGKYRLDCSKSLTVQVPFIFLDELQTVGLAEFSKYFARVSYHWMIEKSVKLVKFFDLIEA